VVGLATAKRLERSADHSERLQHHKDDEALRKRNADAVAAGVFATAVSRRLIVSPGYLSGFAAGTGSVCSARQLLEQGGLRLLCHCRVGDTADSLLCHCLCCLCVPCRQAYGVHLPPPVSASAGYVQGTA
jgi:hypothetical protein